MNYLLQYWTGNVTADTTVNSRHRSLNIMFMTGNTGSMENKFELNYKSTPGKLCCNVLNRHWIQFIKQTI